MARLKTLLRKPEIEHIRALVQQWDGGADAEPRWLDALAFALALADPATTELGLNTLKPCAFSKEELDVYRRSARLLLFLLKNKEGVEAFATTKR